MVEDLANPLSILDSTYYYNNLNQMCHNTVTASDHLFLRFLQNNLINFREYARGQRERRNRFTPADVAFFSSKSDKNVALIFRKIRCSIIHFNIHKCHQLVFDLRRSSTCYPSGLHKKNRYVVEDPSGKAADVFPRKIRGIR